MRRRIVSLATLALSGALACAAFDPPTAPTAAARTAPGAPSSERRDPLDVGGDWIPSAFYTWDWLPGTEQADEDLYHCESYALAENEEWNALRLQQQGTKIVGTSLPNMAIYCWQYSWDGVAWTIDIDDSFDGTVVGDEVRLKLNKYIEVRVAPDPNGVTLSGTIRVRMDPRPVAEPFWVEQPFGMVPWYATP